MLPREYDIMYSLETTCWWHTGMVKIMEQILAPTFTRDSKLLDAGCGTGAKLKHLSKFCETRGIDIHPRAVELCQKRSLKNIQQGDTTNLPFPDGEFSHVVCCEVLQNLQEDEEGVAEAYRVLKTGGFFYISEQACPVLRSRHDISQEAVRRYTRRRLEGLLAKNGFEIRRMTSANSILFPLLAIWRLSSKTIHPPAKARREDSRSDLKPLPRPINYLLRSVLETERAWLKKGDLPFGLTIIALAQKP